MASYVIAYDISHDRRRARVARRLLRYGVRVQKSVFVAQLDSDQLVLLRSELGPHLRPEDFLEIFPIDTRQPDRHCVWGQHQNYCDPVLVVG